LSQEEIKQNKNQPSDERLFPGLSLDTREDVLTTRRGLLSMLLASSVSLFLVTLPFAKRFLGDRKEHFPKVAAGKVSDIPPGKAKIFAYPDKDNSALLVHLANGEWRAYEATCTHLSCLVYWEESSERLICPCHSAAFTGDTGAVLMGPPRRALSRIDLIVEGESVYAIGMKS
jgi:arsenite oxidase small subunit